MKQEQKKHPKDYPEEYLMGKVTFFGREFHVTPDVLIPRLETEWLVRRARDILKTKKYHKVADIGCGSGIIGTSLGDLVEWVILLDISEVALEVARRNFRTYFPEKKADFLVSNLLENLGEDHEEILFLANLPYIKWGDWEHMSADTRYEPELALFGGEITGFELYERLFKELQMNNFGWRLLIEFGFDQRKIAEESIKNYGWTYEFFPDFSGIERFCDIKLT